MNRRPPAQVEGNACLIICSSNGTVITPDLTLGATGRLPNVEGLGLKQVGLPPEGFIAVDERRGTGVPSIFAIGDVTG